MDKLKEKNPVNYLLGVIICDLGVALSTKSGFGLSMIGAVPYIFHRKLISILPWFTQGTSEYFVQFAVLIITALIVKKVKFEWIFSFATAVFTGLCIDTWFLVLNGNGIYEDMTLRIICFILGMLVTSLGIAFFFRTRMPLMAYELAVVEISEKYNWDKSKVKFINDIIYLVLCICLSLLFFNKFVGIGIGTILIAFSNAPLIKMYTKILDKLGVPA